MNKDEAKKVLEKVLNISKERNKNYSELLSYDEEQALSYAITLFDMVDRLKGKVGELNQELKDTREAAWEIQRVNNELKSKIDETIGEK